MNKKELMKLALVGIASGCCLNAHASIFDEGINLAMHSKSETEENGSCGETRGCRRSKGCNSKSKKDKRKSRRKNKSGFRNGSVEKEYSANESRHGRSLIQDTSMYDMSGRRKRAIKQVSVDDRFVGDMDESGRKLRRHLDEMSEETDRFETELDEHGRKLRVSVEDEKTNQDDFVVIESGEQEFGFDADGSEQ